LPLEIPSRRADLLANNPGTPALMSDLPNLIYLGALLAFIGLWFVTQNRLSLGRSLQYALSWALIFAATIAVVGLWGEMREVVRPAQNVDARAGRVELPRAPDGHYYVTAEVNGVPIRFVVDTGATGLVLSRDDARNAGIETGKLAFYGRAQTANGTVRTAPVQLDSLSIGPITDTDLRAWVTEGEMSGSLLGMSYLQRYSRIEISNGELVLTS